MISLFLITSIIAGCGSCDAGSRSLNMIRQSDPKWTFAHLAASVPFLNLVTDLLHMIFKHFIIKESHDAGNKIMCHLFHVFWVFTYR